MQNKQKLILIVGPTAVGKTDISIKIAKEFNGEIISMDSMQIYKEMNIGTAKIKKDEMKGIPHHMLDIVKPNEEFSVSDFKEKTYEYIEQIKNRNKIPILVGGTGFYANSIVYKLNFSNVDSNEYLRKEYMELSNKYGNEYLMNILKDIDEESANRISLNDTKRIIRAIEVFKGSGKKMSENYNFREENDDFEYIYIGLNRDRIKLYDRINKRVQYMLNNGLIEEVEEIVRKYGKNLNSLKAIGYKEIITYLNKEITYEEMKEILKRNSRRFAKRQITWFKRDNRIKWFNYDEFDGENELFDAIKKYINNRI